MELSKIPLVCALFIINNIFQVNAKFCKYEIEGSLKYYMCPRNEYCCNVGCCISPTFQFYQLWYYWLMVIFMFVVCSGGQWWYRYWMNERYVTELRTTMPHHHHHHHHHQVRSHPPVQHQSPPVQDTLRPETSRVSYSHQSQSVYLDSLYKPSNYAGGRVILPATGPPPSYSASTQGAVAGSSVFPPPESPKPSPPYSQIYGPPPSYESAVGLSSIAVEVAQQARVNQQQQQQQQQQNAQNQDQV